MHCVDELGYDGQMVSRIDLEHQILFLSTGDCCRLRDDNDLNVPLRLVQAIQRLLYRCPQGRVILLSVELDDTPDDRRRIEQTLSLVEVDAADRPRPRRRAVGEHHRIPGAMRLRGRSNRTIVDPRCNIKGATRFMAAEAWLANWPCGSNFGDAYRAGSSSCATRRLSTGGPARAALP